jgi:hypothetical protein
LEGSIVNSVLDSSRVYAFSSILCRCSEVSGGRQSGVKYRQLDDTTKLQKEEKVPGSRNARYLHEGGGRYCLQ